MESYKSTCPDCKAVYFWTGFKTGIGKTPEQLAEMDRKQSVCRECGSTKLKTGLDMESEVGSDLKGQYSFLANLITGPDAKRKPVGDDCPVCHEPWVKRCKCPIGDSECKNGHRWYHCPVHGTVFQGSGNHGNNSYRCQCPGGPGDGVRGIS